MQDWDPIGVQDIPEAQDEYDNYVGTVYRLLAEGAPPVALAEHLSYIENVTMGLDKRMDLSIAFALKEVVCS